MSGGPYERAPGRPRPLVAETGLAVYRPDGIYTAAETGITFSVLPDAPDGAVCLTPYPVEDTDLTDAVTGVQVRMRRGHDPRLVEQLADDVFDLLHNRRGLVLGGVHVALIWRQSQAPMGQDVHGRQEISANYYARTTRPSPHLYE
ncbi:minor capsid protein [Streptomyces sp. NPDC050844]|uniref:minor capsid protein n=1 Tax=Streptomyces sp. NPDC050844 TaxID=3155790 RepID=UPI0033CFFC15